MTEIRIVDIIGSNCLVDVDDAQKIYKMVSDHLRKKECVTISFAGVDQIITAFANAAIGQLYSRFSEETIRELITLSEMDDIVHETVSSSVERAKATAKRKQEETR